MAVLLNSATGLRINQTTSEMKIVFTLLDQGMGTCGMMWIVLFATNMLARKVCEMFLKHECQLHTNIFWNTVIGKFKPIQ